MPVAVTCSVCGAKYNMKDDYAGRKVKCPGCQSVLAVPAANSAPADEDDDDLGYEVMTGDVPNAVTVAAVSKSELPEEFHRDKYLMRQKFWSIKEQYNVADEDNEPIIFVERPIHLTKGCLAVVAGLAVMFVGILLAGVAASQLRNVIGQDVAGILAAILAITGVLGGIAVMIQLAPKRHLTFYGDESKTDMLMRAFQDQKWVFINQMYTLADDEGNILCRFRKNYLHGIFRKRWYVETIEGDLLFVVKEDSILLSLLRRTIGIITDEIPLLGLALAAVLRTNFIFCRASDGKVLGEFNRRMTLLDRYVLDLSRDKSNEIDRRIGVAMGVLLDTGEKR